MPDSGTPDAGTPDAGTPDAGPALPAVCPPFDAGSAACPAGLDNCDANPDCETNVTADALNCGRCNRVCGSTATCSAGLCSGTVILNPDVSSNFCHALITPDRLFTVTCWGNNDLSELRVTPLEPGADVKGTQLVAYNNVSVVAMRGLTRDGPDVLFGLEGNPSKVFQVSATDAGPITTRFETDAGTRFEALQVVDDTYFWLHNKYTSSGAVVPGTTIKRRARTDTQDTVLVGGLGTAYDLVTGLNLPEGLTTDGSWLYFKQADAMYRVGLCGSPPQQLSPVIAAHDTQATSIWAADAKYVYWSAGAGFGDSMIYRVAK